MKGQRDSNLKGWSGLRMFLAGLLALLLLPSLAAGSGQATYSAPAAQDQHPDLCEILPSPIGPHIKTPGVGKPGSTAKCFLQLNSQNRPYDEIEITKYSSPDTARDYLQGLSYIKEWTPTSVVGDTGYGYETQEHTPFLGGYGIAFVRGCYVIEGRAGADMPSGPLREVAINIDQQLKKAPCSQATEPPPPQPLRIIRQVSERDCPGKNTIGGWLIVNSVPEGVPTDKVPVAIQAGLNAADTITRFVQVNQPLPLYRGDGIVVPKGDKPWNEWGVTGWIDRASAPPSTIPPDEVEFRFSLIDDTQLYTHCLVEEESPVKLDSGVADVTIKSKDVYETWPEIIQSVLVNILPTSLDDRSAAGAEGAVSSLNTLRLLNSEFALGDVRAQSTPQVYARFTVDASDPNKTLIRVHTGGVKAVPANKAGPAVTVRAGQRVEAVQGKVNSPIADVSVPGSGSRLFSETFFQVEGIFLDYWNGHGGLAQQGFPISEMLREKSDLNGQMYTVQYFERAVFEFHPELAAPNDVLLSQLGTFRYKQKYPQGAPNQRPNTSAGSRLFTETGKRVGGKFLDYWNKNGGLAQQGLPISDEFMEVSDTDGKTYLVQYFERAVFEYHPENAGKPSEVLLSLLGVFFHKQKYGGGGEGSTPPTAVPPTAVPVVACGRRVSPEIYAKWQQLGGEAGFLGCPSADEVAAGPSVKGTTGRSVTFSKGDGGIIVLHQSGARAGKAFEVHGCPYLIYSGQGTTKSALGFPTSDEYDVTGGRRADFEGGYIVWNATTRVCNATLTP